MFAGPLTANFSYLLPPATKLGQGYVFTRVCDSVHGVASQHALQVAFQHALQQVSGAVSQHALQVSRPTPKEEVEGSGLGGSPGPHPGGGIPVCTEADPPRRLLLRAVRIPLECILVQQRFTVICILNFEP